MLERAVHLLEVDVACEEVGSCLQFVVALDGSF